MLGVKIRNVRPIVHCFVVCKHPSEIIHVYHTSIYTGMYDNLHSEELIYRPMQNMIISRKSFSLSFKFNNISFVTRLTWLHV